MSEEMTVASSNATDTVGVDTFASPFTRTSSIDAKMVFSILDTIDSVAFLVRAVAPLSFFTVASLATVISVAIVDLESAVVNTSAFAVTLDSEEVVSSLMVSSADYTLSAGFSESAGYCLSGWYYHFGNCSCDCIF